MGPRSSITGELPIDSYFGSAGAIISNKENGSRKRKTGAGADDTTRTQTKKQRTTQPSKATDLEAKAEARQKAGVSKTRTTSIPTPISAVRLPHSTSSRVPADTEVITISSSSPPREVLPDTGDATRSARNAAGTFGLPTPQTVSHETKKNSWTDATGHRPTVPTVSRSAINGTRPAIPSFTLSPQPPRTPSRPKIKSDHIPLVHRTTPHSQRIVPSSQWSDDEQPNATPSLEANRDPFLLHRTDESGSCHDDLTFLPPSDLATQSLLTTSVKVGVSAHPTFIEPAGGQGWSLENNLDIEDTQDTRTRPLPFKLSDSSRSVLWSSNDFGLQDRNSQIEPTSQLDEIELKAISQRLYLVNSIPSPQTNNDLVPSVERPPTIPLQDKTSHCEAIVEPKSSSTGAGCEPSPPPSPLTPLSSSSFPGSSESLLSDAVDRDIDPMGADRSPSQQPLALYETPKSRSRSSSPEPMVDLELCGTSQPLPEMEVPMEDPISPISRKDENTLTHSPVRRSSPPADAENDISPSDDSPSPVARSHSHISHAKLRSLPDPAIELDSDGEEMSSSSFSIPTSQGMSMSYSIGSCLDLVGTLPSEVGDFFDMVDAYPSSQP